MGSGPLRGTRDAAAVIRAEVDHGAAELVQDPDRPQSWTLLLDGTAQSHVDLADPGHLEFEYVRRIAHVADLAAPPTVPLRTLHLGGGAWTLARYLASTRPGSPQTVVELDAALAELVTHRLPGPGEPDGLQVVTGEARASLDRFPAHAFDLVVLDVFAGARTPAQVTTADFLRSVRRVLAPTGIHVANLGDGAPWPFLPGQVATAGAAFTELALVAAPDVLRGRRFGNLVLVASDRALPVPGLVRRAAADPFPARVLDDEQARALAGGAAVVTDATAAPSPRPPAGFWGQ
ncbi:Methyltransferase domain-containing protein [Pseudonocardia ammonioxydans]|uniref:Methyltransferase domain-containing protein n=1 Tax=Pseudonocardia ammonioxydans TaxID=260086 RepID=A0A1I5ABW1_PSUAM|nr:fused MFS/spermidine synthase [Pseudonocardia ammonioxydans]SFN59912.1 Methyltransferase domain-containing protein [Pseudonocardia ammonioxydans]